MALARRHEFALFFDVENGNPNGDPDNGNMPRMDPETGHGLVSDVCLKRKIRNYVDMAKEGAAGYRIYVTEGAILNEVHREAYLNQYPNDTKVRTATKLSPKSDDEALRLRRFMCDNFFDIRAFGGVLSTAVNAGQVRGPVQISFARSVEPVLPQEIAITRMAITKGIEKREKRGELDTEKLAYRHTMGRKHIIPYGLYRAHGYISAPFSSHPIKGTGFSESDLDLLLQSLSGMFDCDRSAAHCEMTTRKLVVFRHKSALGNAPAHELFSRIRVARVSGDKSVPIPVDDGQDYPPARRYEDYAIAVDLASLPPGLEVMER